MVHPTALYAKNSSKQEGEKQPKHNGASDFRFMTRPTDVRSRLNRCNLMPCIVNLAMVSVIALGGALIIIISQGVDVWVSQYFRIEIDYYSSNKPNKSSTKLSSAIALHIMLTYVCKRRVHILYIQQCHFGIQTTLLPSASSRSAAGRSLWIQRRCIRSDIDVAKSLQ